MFAYSLNFILSSRSNLSWIICPIRFPTLGSARIISLFQTSLTLCRTSTSIYTWSHVGRTCGNVKVSLVHLH